ncbi:TIGR01777 family oxidoreductase [Halalkalibacter krulwichiae]|uniref:Epimerase family protein n=1 Tax=Halalkalibacter krulwichiae TaxID=199441 RepID=A0A1X9M8K8_9BACI|nr:TIGR01777 family oxidoreductase [Halalkalibacter krulwichiae]ARK29014.1 Epimerase family protein [Halalkalibacter krulwichiae]
MQIAIAGGTGFIGTRLTDRLVDQGHTVYILTRDETNKPVKPNVYYVKWLDEEATPETVFNRIDAIVNLAGESIGSGRWTSIRKEQILNSRIESTRAITRLIEKLPIKPKVLVNASAIGYYGHSKTAIFTEESTPAKKDFLSDVVQKWEKEAEKATIFDLRVVYCRLGVVLHPNEGALAKMLLPYRLFAGGPLGTGDQWLSWIHIDDAIQMFQFAIEESRISGPFNVTAPSPCTMNEFGKQLARTLRRPHWLPAPSFALKALLGEMSTLVLDGQQVLPTKAIKTHYSFLYPTLDSALTHLLKS